MNFLITDMIYFRFTYTVTNMWVSSETTWKHQNFCRLNNNLGVHGISSKRGLKNFGGANGQQGTAPTEEDCSM